MNRLRPEKRNYLSIFDYGTESASNKQIGGKANKWDLLTWVKPSYEKFPVWQHGSRITDRTNFMVKDIHAVTLEQG